MKVRWGIHSDVIILYWFTVDIAVMDEDSHHTLEYSFFHLTQFRDLFTYCFHTDVCRQLSFPPGCINSSCGRHRRIKTIPFLQRNSQICSAFPSPYLNFTIAPILIYYTLSPYVCGQKESQNLTPEAYLTWF